MTSPFKICISNFVHFLCVLKINVLVLQKGKRKIQLHLGSIQIGPIFCCDRVCACIFMFMFVWAGKAVSPETKWSFSARRSSSVTTAPLRQAYSSTWSISVVAIAGECLHHLEHNWGIPPNLCFIRDCPIYTENSWHLESHHTLVRSSPRRLFPLFVFLEPKIF